jgi:hypothetical protein
MFPYFFDVEIFLLKLSKYFNRANNASENDWNPVFEYLELLPLLIHNYIGNYINGAKASKPLCPKISLIKA